MAKTKTKGKYLCSDDMVADIVIIFNNHIEDIADVTTISNVPK